MCIYMHTHTFKEPYRATLEPSPQSSPHMDQDSSSAFLPLLPLPGPLPAAALMILPPPPPPPRSAPAPLPPPPPLLLLLPPPPPPALHPLVPLFHGQ